jgi:RNA polymerase sigma-70 factor (ECF subfamily)
MVLKLELPVREIESSDDSHPMPSEVSAGDQGASGAEGKSGGTSGGTSGWRFRLAVAQHHRAVYRLCVGLLRDPHEAEDVTQEAFMRFWTRGGDVRGVKAWLLTVARNACLDRLRTAHRWVEFEPAQLELQADEHDPEWHAKRDESATRLQTLVEQLPEPQRSLVLLFDVEGLTGTECAEALGLNITQVKVYLHRARRRLRRELEGFRD